LPAALARDDGGPSSRHPFQAPVPSPAHNADSPRDVNLISARVTQVTSEPLRAVWCYIGVERCPPPLPVSRLRSYPRGRPLIVSPLRRVGASRFLPVFLGLAVPAILSAQG